MLIDVEARGLVPEGEANRDVMRAHIGEAGRNGRIDEKRERAEKKELQGDAAHSAVAQGQAG